jgi:adenylate cyclase
MKPTSAKIVTLFADIAGSTGLYQRHGDRAALAAVDGCIAVLREVTAAFDGKVIKTVGDELMVTFDNADDAFAAACEMQWRACDLPLLGTDQIALRVGFHLGHALLQDGDVFGDSVNCAARLAGLAKGRQIVTSGSTIARLREQFAALTRKVNRMRLRGSETEEDICLVLWDDSENLTMVASRALAGPEGVNQMLLRYGSTELVLGPGRRSATLGRDESNDLTINSRRASRVHARIEWRGDRFLVIDQSTNGTHVVAEDGTETLLRMEEMILRGSGRMGFGVPAASAGDDVLHYCLQTWDGAPAATG